MDILRILVLEDTLSTFNLYQDEVAIHNLESTLFKFELEHVTNIDDCKSKLLSLDSNYSGAIIDLNLDKTRKDDVSGSQIVDIIKKNLRFPIFIISGTTHHLTDEQKEENELYKIVERGDSFDFIQEFIKIYQTGIVEILNRTGLVESYINDIFWNHLSNSLEPWITGSVDKELNKKSLLRYVLAHLQEYLETGDNGKDLEYNPAEFFITGPIKDKLYTGDIFKFKEVNYVIATPACDISNNKADKVLCLEIQQLREIPKLINQETKQIKKKELEKLITNRAGDRYHFVPSLKYKGEIYNEGVIDFQNHTTFKFSDLCAKVVKGEIERYATVSQPFLKDLIERYSRYYSRQGAPNLSKEKLKELYL